MHLFNKNTQAKKCLFFIVSVLFYIDSSSAQISNDKNYVTTTELKKPGVQTVAAINTLNPQSKVVKVEYSDGLGRSVQTVLLNAKEIGVDIIVPTKYDDLGRVIKQYLPYATGSGSFGAYRGTWENEQLSFYQNNSPAILPNDLPDNNPFSINVYESSPLNRVVQTFAPGDAWAGTAGSGSGEVSIKNEIKVYDPAAGDDIKTWDLNSATGTPIPVISSYTYLLGDLVKTKTFDEHNKQVEEYKDKNGNTILKKVQLANTVGGAGDQHIGWLCTYYVYDDLNRLRYVLPPKVTEYLRTNSWTLTQPIIDELCFWYEYDDRGRLITKHVPGAKPVNMVYDKRDRLIFMQDGNMLASSNKFYKKWLMTIYDYLNRPTATAFFNSINYPTRADLQSAVDIFFQNPEETVSLLGDNFIISGRPNLVDIASLDILTVNYYDKYPNSFPNETTFYPNFNLPYPAGQVTPNGDYPADAAKNNTVTGKLTATKAKILDPNATLNNNPYLITVNYYDKEYRPLQTSKQSLNWGVYSTPWDYPVNVTTTQFDFMGKVLGNQEIIGPWGAGDFSVVTKNILDIEGKVTQIYKGANSTSATKLIVTNEYDKLGRLKTKTTGAGTICENKQDYTYNIRGWLRGVNMNYLNDNILTTNQRYFGYELAYNTLTSRWQFTNTSIKWRYWLNGVGKCRKGR